MDINLDFIKQKSNSPYITKEEVLKILSQTTGTMGKDFLKMQQVIMTLLETLETEKYNRQRDMAFILQILGGTVGKQKLTTLYFEFCRNFDKKHKKKESKENV